MNISKEIFQIKLLWSSRLGMKRGSHLCVLTPIGSKRKVEDEVYEVEKILDNRDSQYLVKWVGYGPEANTWEPVENLLNCKELLNTFHQVTLTAINSTN